MDLAHPFCSNNDTVSAPRASFDAVLPVKYAPPPFIARPSFLLPLWYSFIAAVVSGAFYLRYIFIVLFPFLRAYWCVINHPYI